MGQGEVDGELGLAWLGLLDGHVGGGDGREAGLGQSVRVHAAALVKPSIAQP